MLAKRLSWQALMPEFLKPRLLNLHSASGARHWKLRRTVLGLEVRGDALYLACICPGFGRGELVATEVIPNFTALDAEELRAKLRNILQPLKVEEPVVVLGLPRREVIVRLFNLPMVARKSFQEALALQVEMFKPTDTEPFYWDAPVVAEGKQQAVSLVLAPAGTVERFAKLFAAAGYPIKHLTVTQFSLLHMILRGQQQPTSQRVVLLDSTDSEAELALIEGEKLVYSRSFALSTADHAPEQAVLCEVQRAVSSLRWHEGEKYSVILSSFVSKQIQEALSKLGHVERFEEALDFERLNDGTFLGDRRGAVAVAVDGVGRRRHPYSLNLLPLELRPARNRLRHVPTYALLAANAVFLLAIGLRVPVQDYILLRQYRRELASLREQADTMNGLLLKNRALRQKLMALEEFQLEGRKPLEALNDVTQRLPHDAWLATFTCRKDQIDLAGSAKSASTLLPLLEASPRFAEVRFNGALTQDTAGMERFRIQMHMKEKQ
jgi:Tfp pilus assembly protein PilN